jgi:hypothetical protein
MFSRSDRCLSTLGYAILLGLLYWSGKREQRRWPMILAVTVGVAPIRHDLADVSQIRFDLLLNFGGIGGEFYLCTLLMVSFYFPLPAYWRWDFYRYPVVLGRGVYVLGAALAVEAN